jgi:pre-mRNA-splicing factor CWC22
VPTYPHSEYCFLLSAGYDCRLTNGLRFSSISRMRALLGQINADDLASEAAQRARWDALRKSIQGLVNKVNVANIKEIIPELFGENLIRGRGLFSRATMRAQASSLPFTPVFAALVAIINTKLPQVGELLLVRLVSQFRKAFKRNDKVSLMLVSSLLARN